MADNYLEKKMEDLYARKKGGVSSKLSLEALLTKGEGDFIFDENYQIHPRQLDTLLTTQQKVWSSIGDCPWRFRAVCALEDPISTPNHGKAHAAIICELPYADLLPEATISYWLDLGMRIQTITLKAIEMGLRVVAISPSFSNEVVLAIGKPL